MIGLLRFRYNRVIDKRLCIDAVGAFDKPQHRLPLYYDALVRQARFLAGVDAGQCPEKLQVRRYLFAHLPKQMLPEVCN